MNNENKIDREDEQSKFIEEPKQKPFYAQKPFIIAASIIGAVLFGVVAFAIWRARNSDVGQPVPAPRNVSFDSETMPGDSQNSTEKTLTIAPEQVENIKLETAIVGETLSNEIIAATSTGVVRANDYAETPVISLVGGVVRNIKAQAGDFVRQGEIVAVIYSNELAEAQSNYLATLAEADEYEKRYKRGLQLSEVSQETRTETDRAEADLKIAQAKLTEEKSDFERTQNLVRIGAASRQQLEMATTELKTAQANLEAEKKRLERANQLLKINPERRNEIDNLLTQSRTANAKAESERQKLLVFGLSPQKVEEVKRTRRISSELPVSAPVSGTITQRDVNSNEIVEANKELLKITNLSTVWVIAEVFQQDAAKIRVGSGASVSSTAFPDRIFRGQVTYVDPNINETTRTTQARIELANPDQILKIGTYVNVAFGATGAAEKTVPVVPAAAVQTIDKKPVVFLATDKPNVFTLRQVDLGAEKDKTFIVNRGLNVGDKIVTNGSFLLRAEWLKQSSSF